MLGAITVLDQSAGQGPVFYDRISLAGDGAYPTGGTPGFQALYQQAVKQTRTILAVLPLDCADNVPVYDNLNDKLKVRVMDTGAEVANAVNQSAITLNLLVISK